jgi:hypothetical protein
MTPASRKVRARSAGQAASQRKLQGPGTPIPERAVLCMCMNVLFPSPDYLPYGGPVDLVIRATTARMALGSVTAVRHSSRE